MSQLVACLVDIVQRNITTPASQAAAVCQLALIGLQLLCRLLGTHQPQLFTGRHTNSVSLSVLARVYAPVWFTFCGTLVQSYTYPLLTPSLKRARFSFN